MNWGKGIAIFLVLFIGFITTLAVILMRANTDLVSEDYYLKEVNYGSEIIAEQNAINAEAELILEEDDDGLFIRVKKEVLPEEITVHLLRGNAASDDVRKTTSGSSVYIPKEELLNGKYVLTVNWEIEGQFYQLKEEVWIQ